LTNYSSSRLSLYAQESIPSGARSPLISALRKRTLISFIVALAWFVVLTVTIQTLFGIYYETNDDVGMMMLAQGFGLTDRPTDLLLFTNRLQGLVVSRLGWPFGLPAYSVYLFGCLLISLAAIVGAMMRFNQAFLLNLLVVSALALRPIFAPQFTIIAALLMLAGVLALERYRRGDGSPHLAVAGAFSVLAFLMRPEAMMMMALLSLPLVFRVSLLTSRAALVSGAVTGAVVLAAYWWDQAGYGTPEWAAYNAMDLPRAWFTDFANGALVLKRPDLLASVGWSANDLRMLANWWWLDPDVYSPEKLQRVIDGVGLTAIFTSDASRLAYWAETFALPDMLPSTILALAVLSFVPGEWRWRMTGTVVIFVAVTLLFTMAGRFDVTRIFYPGLTVVVVFALINSPLRPVMRTTIGTVSLLSAILSAQDYISKAGALRETQDSATHELLKANLHAGIFDWAGALPYMALYPTFLRRDQTPFLTIYSLGADQWAPYALSRWHGDARNAIGQFKAIDGVKLIASDKLIDLLGTYCREHWSGQLTVYSKADLGGPAVYHVSCQSASNGTG
jgi:hypothetical protein